MTCVCESCQGPADMTLVTVDYCHRCADEILDDIRARRLASGVGYGAQVGPLRKDFGSGWAELLCSACGAGWVGPIGERCGWCEERISSMRIEQARLDARRRSERAA